MNLVAKNKLIECLELCKEFVKDNNTYFENQIVYASGYSNVTNVGSIPTPKKCSKANDLRKEAELKASKLERESKAVELIEECLKYLVTVKEFEEIKK